MTSVLLRLFGLRKEELKEPEARARWGRMSGLVGIVCNVLLSVAKFIIGTLSGSVAITADAVNNLTDASGSVVTLLGFYWAGKPADQGHPYGHARAEYISGLLVALLILLMGIETLKSSLGKIFDPGPVEFSVALVIVLVLAVLVKLWMCLFNRKLGRAMDSATLEATAADSRNDAISTAAVLLCAVIQKWSGWQLDGFVGLAVAGLILWSGVGVARDTLDLLLGTGPDAELRRQLSQEIMSHPKVLGYHDLLVHDYGPGRRFATIHVEMDAREDPLECHDIIDHIEGACKEKLGVQMSIHYDPVVLGDPIVDQMRQLVVDCVQSVDPRLSIHDFRMVAGPLRTNLMFDIALPYGMGDRKRTLSEAVEAAVKAQDSRYDTVITFDEIDI